MLALSDENGIVKTQYTYDPFGNTEMTGEESDQPFQYTGRENDGTGLYYYRARYYSPELQRFISEDPIGFDGGMNWYAYTGNSPINGIDPLGLEDWEMAFPEGPGYEDIAYIMGENGNIVGTELVDYGYKPSVEVPSGVTTGVAIAAGLGVTLITENPVTGVVAYEVTDAVLGIIFDQPTTIPYSPIDPIINPPCAE